MSELETPPPAEGGRTHWNSRLGFILAAAGSAVGLGNIWKFPYITGENGGGLFVLIYLACIALVGLPIMIAEVFIGREAQRSPVGAFQALSKPRSPWAGIGWLGVLGAFVILSYYSVVAGWAMHYVWLSVTEGFSGKTPDEIGALFGSVAGSGSISTGWHVVFMGVTIAIVLGGIQKGIERGAKILMPALLGIMLLLFFYCMTLEGFGDAFRFVFSPHADKLTAGGALEALGHSFFTLSLGMGAMITYGSYLSKKADIVSTSITISILDTVVALLACMILFPIVFSVGGEPGEGPGLVFIALPVAFSQMAGGAFIGAAFFVLLVFAALSSSISLLEVASAYFIDERKWSRKKAVLFTGISILLLGIPSAWSQGNAENPDLPGASRLFGPSMKKLTEKVFGEGKGHDWLGLFDYLSSNWMLPIGGLGIALFVAWGVGGEARERGFKSGSKFASLYWGWVSLLRYIVPVAILAVILYKIGIFTPDAGK